MDLTECRNQIDVIDRQLAQLLEQRMQVSREVAAYKIKNGKKVYDKEREDQKLAEIESCAGNEFTRKALREVFTQVISISRKLQYAMFQEAEEFSDFSPVPALPMSEHSVIAFFGAPGSYTQQAMEEIFGQNVKSFGVPTFRGIMEAVKQGEADYGILPIENSSTGGLDEPYDLLAEYDHVIVGQHIIKIEQALVGCPGAAMEDIRTVYSHAQGFLQCETFLNAHPEMKQEIFSSTAAAAQKVREDQDPAQAAIASVRAAQVYGLQVLAEKINDEQTNATRFIVVSPRKIYREDANLISLSLSLPHQQGSLYNILSHIIYNDLNMTKIESRPLPGKPFEYRFFIDFEGNLQSAGVQNALRGMQAEADDFRVLGNYFESPVAMDRRMDCSQANPHGH